MDKVPELSPGVCALQFLQDILDTLFVILDDNTEKYGLLVFQSLVSLVFHDFSSFLHIFCKGGKKITRGSLHKVWLFPVEKGLRSVTQDQPTDQADPFRSNGQNADGQVQASTLWFWYSVLTAAEVPGPE